MMYLDQPPHLIETRVFASMPEAFRRDGVSTAWADAKPTWSTDRFISRGAVVR